MSFKEMVRDDIARIFLDPDEVGEPHTINGKEGVYIVMDDFELLSREKYRKEIKDDGTSLHRGLIYVKASDFGRLPAAGKQVTVDGIHFRVEKATNEQGMYAIIIHAVT